MGLWEIFWPFSHKGRRETQALRRPDAKLGRPSTGLSGRFLVLQDAGVPASLATHRRFCYLMLVLCASTAPAFSYSRSTGF